MRDDLVLEILAGVYELDDAPNSVVADIQTLSFLQGLVQRVEAFRPIP